MRWITLIAVIAAILVVTVNIFIGNTLNTDAGTILNLPSPRNGDNTIPEDKFGDMVRLGHKIFTNTPKFAARYVGNSLSCANCHLDAGTKANAAPMWASVGMYPAYQSKLDRVVTLEERIQQCFRFSENGIAPAKDSEPIIALLSYIRWLSAGVVIGVEQPGRGFPTVPRTGIDPSPQRGKVAYELKCANCHGIDGRGNSTRVPPLWGWQSYNRGAGFHRNDLLAGFIKANMPLGNPKLTDQEALDISDWINRQDRPWDPRKGLKELFE